MLPLQDDPQAKEKPTTSHRHWLHSGDLRCLYENGFVRYLSAGNTELIRSIYPAVRDQSWQTAPVTISAEKIDQQPGGFTVSYQADYALDDIRYSAHISVSCMEGKNLRFSFSGCAESDFFRNRIGLCALLPPEGLRGRTCMVGHPGNSGEGIAFPQTIHPEQPFLNIASLDWETAGGDKIRMEFDGDIFETEDQRNWGDASYKVYSTPHHLPLPVRVRKGDQVQQEIRIRFDLRHRAVAGAAYYTPVVFHTGNPSLPFPGIGYCYNPEAQTPDAESIRLLRRLGIDHYRVEIFLSGDWKRSWNAAIDTAGRLGARMLVAVYLPGGASDNRLQEFISALKTETGKIAGLLLFSERDPLTVYFPENAVVTEISRQIPGVRIGSGTDSFFAHWNQQSSVPENAGGFISIPVSPQVHQPDNLTMVENLPAISDIIETTRFHSAAPVIMGPVTLKLRYNPDARDLNGNLLRFPYAHDERQLSLFGAGWTAAALRYLCQADKITLFELTGPRGLMPSSSPEAGLAATRVFPVYLLLREIAAFKPRKVLLSRSMRPTDVDGLVLENIHGDRLMIFCNFTRIRQTLQLKTETWKALPLYMKTLSPANVAGLQEDGEKFRSAPYEPVLLSEGNSCRVAGGAILFLTTLQDWSFS